MVAEHNIALALCHKINVLFSVQTTFVNAEKLAKDLWTPALGGHVLDILVEGGELAYVPSQLLVNLTLCKDAAERLLQDDQRAHVQHVPELCRSREPLRARRPGGPRRA